VASALSSGVTLAATLFVNGEQYEGELDAAAVSAALETVRPRPRRRRPGLTASTGAPYRQTPLP
jgi:hypothetical protein